MDEKLYVGGFLVITVTNGDTQNPVENYLFKDHLGSVSVVADAFGTVVQRMSFDPWGRRREADNWSELAESSIHAFAPRKWQQWQANGTVVASEPVTTRGYTGHEMIDTVGLVHMNGRVYDPILGRFLSADTFIQAPEYTQSFNRYSYVINNPLSATNPVAGCGGMNDHQAPDDATRR